MTFNTSAVRAVVSEAELQRRVIAAETLLTTQRSWMLAAISAIAAAASAVAAVLAVIFGRNC